MTNRDKKPPTFPADYLAGSLLVTFAALAAGVLPYLTGTMRNGGWARIAPFFQLALVSSLFAQFVVVPIAIGALVRYPELRTVSRAFFLIGAQIFLLLLLYIFREISPMLF